MPRQNTDEGKILAREDFKRWYSKNKAGQRSRVQKRKNEIIEWFRLYRSTLKCEKCGFDNPAALDFHHIIPEDKSYAVNVCVHMGYCKERILEEINKCIVLCSNCHRILHHNERELE
jgi:hypothetical protein